MLFLGFGLLPSVVLELEKSVLSGNFSRQPCRGWFSHCASRIAQQPSDNVHSDHAALCAGVHIMLSFRESTRQEHGHARRAARLSLMASALQQPSCSQAKACGSACSLVATVRADPTLDSGHGVEFRVQMFASRTAFLERHMQTLVSKDAKKCRFECT